MSRLRRPPAQPTCPACSYDLSGLVASWTTQCPLSCVCPECGQRTDLGSIFNRSAYQRHWFIGRLRRRSSVASLLWCSFCVWRAKWLWRRIDHVNARGLARTLSFIVVSVLVAFFVRGVARTLPEAFYGHGSPVVFPREPEADEVLEACFGPWLVFPWYQSWHSLAGVQDWRFNSQAMTSEPLWCGGMAFLFTHSLIATAFCLRAKGRGDGGRAERASIGSFDWISVALLVSALQWGMVAIARIVWCVTGIGLTVLEALDDTAWACAGSVSVLASIAWVFAWWRAVVRSGVRSAATACRLATVFGLCTAIIAVTLAIVFQ